MRASLAAHKVVSKTLRPSAQANCYERVGKRKLQTTRKVNAQEDGVGVLKHAGLIRGYWAIAELTTYWAFFCPRDE